MCPTTKLQTHEANLIELQGEMGDFTITVGDFNTPLLEIDKSSRQKISKDIIKLKNTINQLDIIDIYLLLCPTMLEYAFFVSSNGT